MPAPSDGPVRPRPTHPHERGAARAGALGGILVVLVVGLVVVLLARWASGGADTTQSGQRPGATATAAAPTPDSGLRTITESDLPPEGRVTLRLIREGGPYPYARDGATFQNRERILPGRRSGYYREYTVPTPGESDRGARRIVSGSEGDRYYTDDHYRSFRQIEEGA